MQFGPKIVTNGLALALDAADMNSYSPNVARSSTDIFNWCQNASFNACTISRDSSITRQYRSIPLKMVVTGNDAYISSYGAPTWNLAPAANGQTWTISVYVKASVATTGELFIFGADIDGYYGGVGTYGSNGAISITTSWTRVSFTTTMNGVNVAFIQVRLDGPNTGGTGQTIWWDGLQVERSSSPTTFNPYYYGNTIWRDISANNTPMTLVNSPTFNSEKNGSILFNGSNNYAQTTPAITYGNNTTWEAWVNRSVSANEFNMFMGAYLPYFGLRADGSIIFSNTINSVQQTLYSTGFTSSNNTWYYLSFTTDYNGTNTTARIYINGVLNNSATFTGAQSASGYRFGVGDGRGDSTWYPFNGKVSSVKVYNRLLTATEIQQNYNTMKNRFGL